MPNIDWIKIADSMRIFYNSDNTEITMISVLPEGNITVKFNIAGQKITHIETEIPRLGFWLKQDAQKAILTSLAIVAHHMCKLNTRLSN